MNMEERGAFYRRGWAAPKGWPAKEALLLFMVLFIVVTPLFMVVTPSST
jgi:hypothetical protein